MAITGYTQVKYAGFSIKALTAIQLGRLQYSDRIQPVLEWCEIWMTFY